jgi:hypothetical protein
MQYLPEFQSLINEFDFVDYSPSYHLGEFACRIREYNEWLVNDASIFIDNNLTRIHLLIHKETKEIAAYVALCADSFIIEKEASRFLTVDADVEYDPDTPRFYEKNGFVYNQHDHYKKRTDNKSMRYDLFEGDKER